MEMKKAGYYSFMPALLILADHIGLSIPNYRIVIINPLDISTVASRLSADHDTNLKDFENDMRQIVRNYNKSNRNVNPVREVGLQFQESFISQ